jgi:hypothetical protein
MDSGSDTKDSQNTSQDHAFLEHILTMALLGSMGKSFEKNFSWSGTGTTETVMDKRLHETTIESTSESTLSRASWQPLRSFNSPPRIPRQLIAPIHPGTDLAFTQAHSLAPSLMGRGKLGSS